MYYIGIDIGGTNLKAGLVDESYQITATKKQPLQFLSMEQMGETLADMAIALVEAGLYCKLLQGRSRARAFAYGLAANAASALLGWYLAEPVWRWIVTIC